METYWKAEEILERARLAESVELPASVLIPILEAYLNPWISVEERLPEDGSYILIAVPDMECSVQSFYVSERNNSVQYYQNIGVEGWMPLPNPPKE